MKLSLKMIKKHPLKFTALIFFIIFCALSSFVYFTLGAGSTKSLIEQMLHREQIIARSGTKSISSFIELSSKSLLVLANEENLSSDKLKDFIDNWANTPVVGIIQSDAKGQIIAASSNIDNLSPGGNIADRDYFQTAKNFPNQKIIVGEPVISRATGANQNYKIPLATSIYKNGQFKGIISLSISVSSLTQDYLESLKISNQSDIILIDKEGHFLSSVHPEIIGQSIFEYITNHPFLGDKILMPKLKEYIEINNEQKIDIAIPNLYTGKITRTLIATSPINIDNNQWILVITTPVSDALVFISPFILRNLLGIIFSFFISIAITLFLFNRYLKNNS